jgi:UDP-glucuronate decarboxylase
LLDAFGLRAPDARRAYQNKTVLIAGGAGFLGSALAKRLYRDGTNIICVDNLLTGSLDNLLTLWDKPGFSFIRADIIKPLVIDGPVDEIYNLACPASPPRYQIDPIHTFRTCVDGTLNLLQLAEHKGARILQSSTSEVYGDPEIPLQNETYRGNVNTCGPRACYDEGKRAGETLFWEYGAHRGVETRIARIFNTYGPFMHPDDGRVVSNFIVQALRGQPLTIYGDGSQTRSFCYVDDLVEGLVRLMASQEKMPVNLGNPGEFTMLSLAEKVLAKVSSGVPIVFHPLPQDDPLQRRPDISRAKDILGWAPTVPLDEGLDRTIAWFSTRVDQTAGQDLLVS